MQIIKKSILDLTKEANIFYELSRKLSCASAVDIAARKFVYTLTNNHKPLFGIETLQEIFHDWKEEVPWSKRKIAGNITETNHAAAQRKISLCLSDHNLQLTSEEIILFTNIFWREIAAHITLPPTHVYIHEPDTNSIFDFGIYWKFCYIYLNNNTKQGIVIAADASD